MSGHRSLSALFVPLLLLAAPVAGAQSAWAPFMGGRLTAQASRSTYIFAGNLPSQHFDVRANYFQLMWQPIARDPSAAEASVASRVSIGAFYEETPPQNLGLQARYVGGTVELRPWPFAILGHIEPIAELGLGQFSTRNVQTGHAPIPIASGKSSYFAAAPGVGVRLRLISNIGIRGDARDLITSNSGNQHTFAYRVGLTLLF